MRTVSRLVISMVVVSCVSLALYWAVADRSVITSPVADQAAKPGLSAATTAANSSGPDRATEPVAAASPTISPDSSPNSTPESSGPTLESTAVPGDTNPNVASVVEAQRSGLHPERLTPFIAPAAFDPAAFAKNPQAYLDVVEPGRIWLTAESGPAVTPLSTEQTDHIRIPYLGSTTLTVRAVPLAPVTFTVLDGGMLPNHLGSMTVRADDQGLASTVYTATPGTVDDVQVLAGSPLAAGTVTLVVHVLVEERPASEPVAAFVPQSGDRESAP
jgi:hypothetical protein